MVKLLPKYLLLICSAVAFDSASQNSLEFIQLAVKDGLPNSTVTCFYQDSRNFLWVGTGNGLCKYNGTSFKVFRNDPFDTSSLSGNHINDIIGTEVQGEEILWIGTEFNGVTAFNLVTNSILQFKNQEEQSPILLDNRCSDLLLLSNGLIAVVNMKGIDFIDPVTFTVYKDPYKAPVWATDIRESEGMLYIASRQGILTAEIPYLKNGDYVFPFESKQQILSDHSISFVLPTDSTLLLGTTDGFFRYDQVYDNLTRVPLPAGNITSTVYHFGPSALDKSKNQIWLSAAEHGVFRYSIKDDEAHWLAGSNSIYPDKVNCTYIDHFGSLWLGTYRDGALKASLTSATFRKTTLSDSSIPFGVNDIYSIYMLPNDHLLVGTSTGGIYIAKEGEKLAPLRFNTGNPFISQSSIIGSYHYDSDNENLWVGNMSKSLLVVPLKLKDIPAKHTSGPPIAFRGDPVFNVPNISGWSVRDIEKDDNGSIWVGTFDGGLTKLAAQSLNKELVINPSLLHGIREIFNPEIGWDNFLLISCTRGLVFLNTETNELTHVNELLTEQGKQPPLENTIWGVYQESPSRFWLCTTTNGIALLEIEDLSKEQKDIDHITISYFNEKHGIPSGELFGIIPDSNRNLWISGERSLIKFSIVDYKVRVFTKQDKIGQEAFNFGAYAKSDSSGTFYFGGNDGITSFKPSEIASTKTPILPLISGMRVNGKELEAGISLSSGFVLEKNIAYSDFIRLAYNENLVTFTLNIFNADISLANHLFYKLEGVDNEWQKVDEPEYFATYSNLKPGKYKMRLKAENLTEGAEDSFSIEVAPPWYVSGLAKFIYGILMLSGIAFFFRVGLVREPYLNQPEIELNVKKSEDQSFIKEVNEIIERNLADSEFNTEQLARFLGLSRSKLFKKMKSLLGTTAGEYILSFRMKMAKAYLSRTDKYVSEICYSVGFSEPKHFTRTFKKHTGLTPSQYRQKNSSTVSIVKKH